MRYIIKINGIVQGVGFRPFIYNLAKSIGLNGWVKNVDSCVIIDIEGKIDLLDEFINKIKLDAPILSSIKSILVEEHPPINYSNFEIKISDKSENNNNIFISPDVSMCLECENEMLDNNNRRYLYPFINCTNCGPRFTIITDFPYDRKSTTMNKFKMCDRCYSEYTNPSNRRYHAQPISCYNCGPQISLLDNHGKKINVKTTIVKKVCELLQKGKIVAVKGIGGFHLSCDAYNEDAVSKLRKRKIREDKPFAVMAKDIKIAKKYCYVSKEEESLLNSYKKPIVLLRKRDNFNLSENIAPKNNYLGIMLPYTPIHKLLFFKYENIDNFLELLVMTSGNKSKEPIYYNDSEAIKGLQNIADYFLTHDRDIYFRNDDTVTRVFNGKEYILRRARGYVPTPIECDFLNKNFKNAKLPSVLSCGADLKNTFCVNKDLYFYLSHHIGDLENFETFDSFNNGIEFLKKTLDFVPEIIAYDMHPGYMSTKYANDKNIKIKKPIQHHHAHIASCMVENNLCEEVIGIAFDGTGYGLDGNIWGGEFFYGSYLSFERIAHFSYSKMPGNDMTVKEPWRMGLSYLYELFKDNFSIPESNLGIIYSNIHFFKEIETKKILSVLELIKKNIYCASSSSAGRLFEGISSLLGIKFINSFEGQAAIELEYYAIYETNDYYPFSINFHNKPFLISLYNIIKGIVDDIHEDLEISIIASKFHETVSRIVLDLCNIIRNSKKTNTVVLSGGVFQNIILLNKCITKLNMNNFIVYTHKKIPANDGGISLGQSVIAILDYLNK